MSDNWLQLVPADPLFQPAAEAAEQALMLFTSFLPDADEVTFSFKDQTEFIYPMASWSGVTCPSCGADAEPWWYDAMQERAETNFENLVVTAPCCGSRVSLNELHYVWPAAFGRFVLEALNPNIRDLSQDKERALSQLLGCDIRKIWVHI